MHIPIGLIQVCVGSTAAEAWTSETALHGTAEFKPLIGKPIEPNQAKSRNEGDQWARSEGDKGMPAALYNGMILNSAVEARI